MCTAERSLRAASRVNLADFSATAPALLFFGAPLTTILVKPIGLVNFSLAARASTQRPSRSAIRRTAPSKCNSTEKHFRARRSPAWKRSLLPLSCAAASRAAPSEGLRRTNRIPASLPCSLSSAEFPRALFRRSRGFPGIWAHPPAVRHSMKLYETLRSNRVTIAGRFSWLRLALAFSSAVAGSLLTKMENRKWKLEILKLGTRNSLQGPGRVRAVKLTSTAGTTQPCNGGQPASVTTLRHSETIALSNCEGSTAPFSASAYAV